MSTMIERVARVIRRNELEPTYVGPSYQLESIIDLTWQSALPIARAAIAAMREPTEEMLNAWIRAPGAIKGGWQAMIDCASRETDDEPVAKG